MPVVKSVCMRIRLGLVIFAVQSLLSACAFGTGGPVQIGPDTYMLGGQGGWTDISGSAVKARFFEQANAFCAKQGRTSVPLDSTAQDSGMGTFASAEVQFRCVSPRR
jgi:hypothetical protein